MYGWLFSKNMPCSIKEEKQVGSSRKGDFFKNLLNKFPDDVVYAQTKEFDCFFDGYILDKQELCSKYEETDWKDVFIKNCKNNIVEDDYRGGFCGFVAYEEETSCFVDHLGNRTLYYYFQNNRLIISNNMNYVVKALRENEIEPVFDENAAKYLMSFGAMPDDTTFVKDVKRVLPGYKIHFKNGKVIKERYYQIDNRKILKGITEDEAIEMLDASFRCAIKREFDKDREYGYRHLVDLSGGLDSRMVTWVAHAMGYTDQVNVSYSRSDYLDQKISKQIAIDLKHQYLFTPLDDCNWVYDVDEIVKMNNGAALYSGISGGNRVLSLMNTGCFGIEHTGMVGDVIPSSFYKEEEIAYGSPRFDLHRYSNKLSYEFDSEILEEYPNQEIFALHTRGILCAASSYIIRQKYVETSSPFLDVDFVNTCMSLPFEYRKKHYIYLKWMEKKYPQATEYGWEKWGGVKPKLSHIKYRRFVTAKRLLQMKANSIVKRTSKDNMNPLEYWYVNDKGILSFYQNYYEQNIDLIVVSEDIRNDMKSLFETGTATEKAMVLTILGIFKNYFKESE